MTQNQQRLLHPFIGVPSIYFPVGKLEDGGTCEFATEKCLSECAVYKHLFSDEIIPYQTKEAIYEKIITRNPLSVAYGIIDELKEMNSNLLCWFASGDCPLKDTEQICQIVRLLQFKGINQSMITRSFELFRSVREKRANSDSHAIVGIALTIESIDAIGDKAGLFVLPNYEKGSISFLRRKADGRIIKTSSFSAYDNQHRKKEVISLLDCKSCFAERVGCFSEGK